MKSITKASPQPKPHLLVARPRKRPKLSRENSRASDASVKPGELCSRCKDINLEEALNTKLQVPESGFHITALGKPNTKAFRQGCPLCDLFLSVATTYKRQYDLELRLFDQIPGQKPADRPHLPAVENRFIAVVRQNERLVYDSRIAHEIGPSGILAITPMEAVPCPVCSVNLDTIDYSVVKDWLGECLENHTLTCAPVTEKTSDLRLHVIDCQDNTIKLLPRSEEYVALSYVWGRTSGTSRFDTSTNDGVDLLSACDVPLTIRDAMRVVSGIGRQYLWVDRYCIPHTDAARRAEAILNMNQIYSDAVATIVVLHGESADDGIPGASIVSRQGCQQVEINNRKVISSLLPLKAAIKKSTWSKRGWTFQEARLSRRCLFLSDQQTYYSCQVNTLSESLPQSCSSFPASKHLRPTGLEPSMFAPGSNLMFSGIFLDRLSYSQRTLTYQTDALDAFRGVLRVHPFITFWGVPVAHNEWTIDPAVCFTMGLLWVRRSLAVFEAHMPDTHTGSYERRIGFPTWSWASIIGEVFQFGTNETCTYRNFFRVEAKHEWEELHSAIEVRLKDSRSTLQEAVKLATANMLPETSPLLVIRGDLVRVKRETNTSIKAGKLGHVRYRFCGEDDKIATDVYVLPRIDLDENDVDSTEAQDALILIDWRDGGKRSQRRFILMLLKWVEKGVAERVGLLGRYYEKWNVSFLERLYKRKVEFELR